MQYYTNYPDFNCLCVDLFKVSRTMPHPSLRYCNKLFLRLKNYNNPPAHFNPTCLLKIFKKFQSLSLGAKQIEQEEQRFDDVFLAMTSFCAKKSEKIRFLGEEKYLKAEKPLKSSLMKFFNDI